MYKYPRRDPWTSWMICESRIISIKTIHVNFGLKTSTQGTSTPVAPSRSCARVAVLACGEESEKLGGIVIYTVYTDIECQSILFILLLTMVSPMMELGQHRYPIALTSDDCFCINRNISFMVFHHSYYNLPRAQTNPKQITQICSTMFPFNIIQCINHCIWREAVWLPAELWEFPYIPMTLMGGQVTQCFRPPVALPAAPNKETICLLEGTEKKRQWNSFSKSMIVHDVVPSDSDDFSKNNDVTRWQVATHQILSLSLKPAKPKKITNNFVVGWVH